METQERTVRNRPRYSLLNLLLLMTVVALSLALWNETNRRIPLQRQVESLRREVGEVVAAEPDKLYVQPLEDTFDARMQFRWRAYVPRGQEGEVVVQIQNPQQHRVKRLTLGLGSGETSFELVAVPPVMANGTSWQYVLRQPMASRGAGGSGPAPPWIDDRGAKGGLAFSEYDATLGAASGGELTLMDSTAQSEETPTRVIVRVKHYPNGKSPVSSSSSGSETLSPSQ